jgi:hypothetical protein
MTYLAPLNTNTNYAKAQQEAFVQRDCAGRRVPVVFSHILFAYSMNNNTRKGAYAQLSHSASDAAARRLSHNSTKEVTNSLPVIGRPASFVSKKSTNNSFFTFFNNHNKD